MFTRTLIDIATGLPVRNAEIFSPLANRLFAPFLDFPNYFLTFSHPKIQLLSWLAWLWAVWITYALVRLKGPARKRTLMLARGLIVTMLSFILFIVCCIFCPLPQYRITSQNPEEVFLDLHSHTIYSHDGIVTPERNFQWHMDSGFSGWAVTEHDRVGTAVAAQQELVTRESLAAVAITGQEISFRKVHLNLLGIKEDFYPKKYGDLTELIRDVHRRGGAVVIPHYWAETKSPFSMKDLAEAGVDAFEITGNASVPLTQKTQREIIELCRKEGLVMVSGTNWHGWRNFCTAWTGLNVPGWKRMDIEGRERAVIDALRNRKTGGFRVIGYKQEVPAVTNYILEPFTGFFSYFTSIDIWQQLSWLFWIAVICFLLRRIKNRRIIAVALWEVITLLLLVKTILVFNTWNTVSNVNEILPEAGKALIALAVITSFLSATTFLSWKKSNNNRKSSSANFD